MNFIEQAIGANGVNVNVDTLRYDVVSITGTVTITSNKAIQSNTALPLGKVLVIYYNALTTYNGGVLSIFGKNLTQDEAISKQIVFVSFNGTDYEVRLVANSKGFLATGTEVHTLSNTTKDLVPSLNKNFHIITGTSLTGTFTLTGSSFPNDGNTYYIYYAGSITSGDVNLFGYSLNETEKAAGELFLIATYSSPYGGYIVVPINPVVEKHFELCIPVSYEIGEQGRITYVFGRKVEVLSTYSIVVKALSGTDSGSTVIDKNTAAMTGGTVTHAASAAFGNVQTAAPSDNNIFSSTDTLGITSAKSTAGGKTLLFIRYKELF